MLAPRFTSLDMFAVHRHEPIGLIASLMDRERIRHLAVVTEDGVSVHLAS